MKELTKKIRALEKKRNTAREKLYQIMNDNDDEWNQTRKIQKTYEIQFVKLWKKYNKDPNFVEKEFFECCNNLSEYIKEEKITDKRFKKIYMPYYEKFQELDKKYNQMKLQQSRKPNLTKKEKSK